MAWLISGQNPALAALAVATLLLPTWAILDHIMTARHYDHRNLLERPEFYDHDLLNQPMHMEELGGRSLKSLSYVVFDTETTGLNPSSGDEIISIAGVRVRNGKLERGDVYTSLVNPGRKIPKASIQFHGITDDVVANERDIATILPEFKTFVGDSALVAHKAAFDMKFLKLKEVKLQCHFRPHRTGHTFTVGLHARQNHTTYPGCHCRTPGCGFRGPPHGFRQFNGHSRCPFAYA